jgi:hypothetical protein
LVRGGSIEGVEGVEGRVLLIIVTYEVALGKGVEGINLLIMVTCGSLLICARSLISVSITSTSDTYHS